MGKIIKGILGGFSGLTGTVVGAEWRGLDVIRSRPKKSSKPPTALQIAQRAAFKIMSDFMQEIRDIVAFGFQSHKTGKTPYNAAFSVNLENAITGVYPLQTVDYSKIVIASGGLRGVNNGSITTAAVAEIDFSWDINALAGNPRLLDKLTILVYCPMMFEYVAIERVADRSAGTYTLSVPGSFSSESVHCWAFFSDEKGKRVSDSRYLGAVTVL